MKLPEQSDTDKVIAIDEVILVVYREHPLWKKVIFGG